MMFTPLFIGTTEMLLIAAVALLLFGGKKLPEMMRGMGQGIKEFKKGMHEVSEPIEEVKETILDAADLPKDKVVDSKEGASNRTNGTSSTENDAT